MAEASFFSRLAWLLADTSLLAPQRIAPVQPQTMLSGLLNYHLFPLSQDNAVSHRACEQIPSIFTGATKKVHFLHHLCGSLLL